MLQADSACLSSSLCTVITLVKGPAEGQMKQSKIQYDVMEEFCVDSKAELVQLTLTHTAKNKNVLKKKLKQQTPVPT